MTPQEFEELIKQAQENPQSAPPAPAPVARQPMQQAPIAPQPEPAWHPPMAPVADDTSSLVKDAIAARAQQRQQDISGMNNAYTRASQNRFGAELGSAASDTGYAIAGIKNPNPGAYDDMKKSANMPIEQEQAQRTLRNTQAGEDPNSAKSLTYKAILKATYPDRVKDNVLEGAAYDDATMVDKLFQGKELSDQRRQSSADQLAAREDARREGVLNRQASQNQVFAHRDMDTQNRADNRSHAAILNKIKGNKILQDSITKSQNLVNTINNIESTGKITPQDMADVQSLAIANMGIGGASSAHERSERYAKTLGIKAADAMQFLTGTPQDIGKDNPLFSRYKDIMLMEVENFRSRVGQSIKGLRSGNASMYRRQPDLSGDIDELESEYLGQIPQGNASQSAQRGTQSAAVPATQHPQSNDALSWAKQNPTDPRAQEIIKRLGGG